MARLTDKELQAIIKRDAPGHRIVARSKHEDAMAPAVTADEGTPDLAELRRKFLGPDAATDEVEADGAHAEDASGNPGSDDVEMVTIEPDQRPTPWDHGSRAKVVVVSGKDKKIIGSQG